MKRIIPILFLFVMFLPGITKGYHDFQHRYDKHCNDYSDKHFHTLEHNCKICDYNVPVGFTNAEFEYFSFSLVLVSIQHVKETQLINSDIYNWSSPRAPPVLI